MNLYDQIAEACASPHGWCTELKARTLASLVIGTRPSTVVEIGVWSGKSLLPMALACRENNFGYVIGIDPYEPTASVEGQTGANKEWWASVANHQAIHDYFLAQVEHFGVGKYVRLIRNKSDDVLPPMGIGLLNIDGNHGPQALVDTTRFAPFVALGRFVVLDDLHWEGGAVSESADWLINHGFTELFRVTTPPDDWAVFQRTK